MMLYRPLAAPVAGNDCFYFDDANHTVAAGGKYWYYVELGPDGSNNHTGKVLLVLAEGVNTGTGVILTSPDKYAGILVRRNGDVSLTTDSVDFETASLK